MLKEEITHFLAGVMPFSFLSEEELRGIVEDIAIEYYPRGVKILTQNGPPSEHLAIIKKGGVKIFITSAGQEETVIDYRSEGEQFGLLSLIGGDRSRTNVEAIEDTICYLIAKEKVLTIIRQNPAANEYFLKSFFINFIDKTYEKTNRRQTGTNSADRLLYITPVGKIVRRQPVTAIQTLSIREAAVMMALNKISSLIVMDEGGMPVGMLTDRDLREKVVATGMDVASPIGSIMSASLVSVDAREYCFEALLKMMRHKIHHILVMDNNRLKGMVTNHDFMTLQGSSPTALVKDIAEMPSLEELRATAAKTYKTVAVLLGNGAKAHNITGFFTELVEKITNRIAELLEEKLGMPPRPYTLFFFGEAGRRELSLDCNIRLGLIYKDADQEDSRQAESRYFASFADQLNSALKNCFGSDRRYLQNDDIKSFADWQDFLSMPINQNTTGPRARFFEMRTCRGMDTMVTRLRNTLLQSAAKNDDFMELVAASTLQNKPPLGFFKNFVVEKSGEHKDQLNLYQKGIKPLVDIIRIMALEKDIASLSSKERVQALVQQQFEQAKDIEFALDYLYNILLHKQLAQIEAGRQADNFVNPEDLNNFEKKTIKESFHLITMLYENIAKKYSAGW